MTDGIHSPANAHLAELAQVRAQVRQQSEYIEILRRENSNLKSELADLRRRIPRPAGKHYPNRLGSV